MTFEEYQKTRGPIRSACTEAYDALLEWRGDFETFLTLKDEHDALIGQLKILAAYYRVLRTH